MALSFAPASHRPAASVLALDDLHYTFEGWPAVVKGVSLKVAAGEVCCLLGRSGCGKTTLLKLAAGLLAPDRGQVWVQGQPVTSDPSRVGLVFQSPTLLDWLDVLDNVLLSVSLKRRITSADRQAALELLGRLGLSALCHQRPWQLSGGQQSRVAIARALLLRPALLLMDEPFAALDAMTREDLQNDLLRMCGEHQTAVLFVTHDIQEAVYLGDQVCVMQGGQLLHTHRLQAPRTATWRYSADFASHCATLRGMMDQTVPVLSTEVAS